MKKSYFYKNEPIINKNELSTDNQFYEKLEGATVFYKKLSLFSLFKTKFVPEKDFFFSVVKLFLHNVVY